METTVSWNAKYNFKCITRNHEFEMDGTFKNGSYNRGPTPKEMLLSSVSACAGIDVAYFLEAKGMLTLDINASAIMTKTKPSVFESILLKFIIVGELNKDDVLMATHKSMTELCGVSAMLTKASPIFYEVYLNSEFLTKGESKFSN